MRKLHAVLALSLLGTAFAQDQKVRVLVTDDPIFEHTGIVRGSSGFSASGNRNGWSAQGGSSVAGVSHTQNGADPRTTEMQAEIFKACPSVIVTSNPKNADYVLVLRREGGKRSSMFAFGGLSGLALSASMKVDKVAVFNRDGDMVFGGKARSVGSAAKDACSHMVKYAWKPEPEPPTPVPAAAPAAAAVAAPAVMIPATVVQTTASPTPLACQHSYIDRSGHEVCFDK